jgi:hypothetical protein
MSKGRTISQYGCSTFGALATKALEEEEEIKYTERFTYKYTAQAY